MFVVFNQFTCRKCARYDLIVYFRYLAKIFGKLPGTSERGRCFVVVDFILTITSKSTEVERIIVKIIKGMITGKTPVADPTPGTISTFLLSY